MTQAIVVKYLSPTNTRGARFKATAWGGSITLGRDYALSTEENETAAARALCDKLGWPWRHVCGGLPNGDVVFVPMLADYTATEVRLAAHAAGDYASALRELCNEVETGEIARHLPINPYTVTRKYRDMLGDG